MNILILTGKFGMGHWAASQALQQQLLSAMPGAEIKIVDFPAYAMPAVSETMYRGFDMLVTHGSHLFNLYYKFTELGRPDARPMFRKQMADKLLGLIALRRPDAVIATHPLCAQVMSSLRQELELELPLITCVTDVTAHPEWINSGTDCYLVASEQVRNSLTAQGVARSRIFVTGIPVGERFHSLKRCGCTGPRRLLIMGGGLGLLPTKESFYRELNRLSGVHTTIVTGKNAKLYDKIHGKYENIEVLGYTDRVADLMAQADLIVTKPGGITLFETIYAELPILAWPPFLQQEKYNARWLVSEGIGWVTWDENCVEELGKLLFDDRRLNRARENMRRVKSRLELEGLNRLMAMLDHREKEVCA